MGNEQIAATDSAMPGRVEEIACDVLWPCTRSPTQVCQVLSNLATHNRVLWHLGLHLREDPRDNVGELSVVQAPGFNAEPHHSASDERAESFAIAVLRRLFEEHRCIVAAEVNHVVAKTDSLLGSLAAAPCLRRLTVAKIQDCEPILEIDSWVMTTFNITGKRAIRSHSDTSSIGAALNAVGILLQRTDNVLKTLDIAALEITGHALRRRIILALCKNRTIAELAVPYSVIACDSIAPRNSAKPFALYLARADATLRKLAIGSCSSCTATTLRLGSLIPAIWRMSTLEELNIVVHFNMREYEQFADVVANSQSLRSFAVRCCRDLQVSLLLAPFHEADPRRLEAEAAIVEALSAIHHVTKLTLTTGPLREQHYRRLADRVLENLGLRELSVTVMNDSFCDVFLDRLLPGLRYNYNIVRLQLEHSGGTFSDAMATAQNIVRRNCSIERRAVQFVMGVHDPYCARVVEIAAERLGFVEAVRREAVVTKTEAAEKLKEALSIVRLADVPRIHECTGWRRG
ncbi:hypothetical protein HPB52_011911 [Rhipicephalus sanguineus]|uniref:Uncharacterized protein n=1 Tax=Rhipicephalus sanguineus TaxID=34632 RepID=A0A9D4T495_RHISA|nr:hypothetical protein HPB52_011911 [Rhipicephalus sanguineus]